MSPEHSKPRALGTRQQADSPIFKTCKRYGPVSSPKRTCGRPVSPACGKHPLNSRPVRTGCSKSPGGGVGQHRLRLGGTAWQLLVAVGTGHSHSPGPPRRMKSCMHLKHAGLHSSPSHTGPNPKTTPKMINFTNINIFGTNKIWCKHTVECYAAGKNGEIHLNSRTPKTGPQSTVEQPKHTPECQVWPRSAYAQHTGRCLAWASSHRAAPAGPAPKPAVRAGLNAAAPAGHRTWRRSTWHLGGSIHFKLTYLLLLL